MKIVIDPEMPFSIFKIDKENNKPVPPSGMPPVFGPFDENALEAALKIKDQQKDCKITVLSMGKTLPKAVLQKVKEELIELEQAIENNSEKEIDEELGDLLFTFVNFARFYKLNPEESLHQSNQKFLERFKRLEIRAQEENRPLESLSPEEMDNWWERIKK